MAVTQQQAGKITAQAGLFNIIDKIRRLPWVAIIILAGFVFVSVFSDFLVPHDPFQMSLRNRFQPPGSEIDGSLYLFGTDTLGRDLLSRVIYGARVSLIIAMAGLLMGGGIGLMVGIVAGYVGGKVDALLMRLTDVFMALPTLFVALVFVMTLGPGLTSIVIALSVVTWSRFSRIIRSEVLLLKERDFVLQAKVAGCSDLRIMLVHILPNVFNTFIVISSLQVSDLILTEATLSFLGAGVPPPTPTWGNMVADGRDLIGTAWWISVVPGLALTLVVFSFNIFGDWLRDRLDPKLRQI